MKLRRGDQVKVIAGKDRGRTGRIEKVFPKLNQVLIPGINLYKKHLKPQGEGKPGGIVEVAKPLPVAKVMLLCPKCNQPTRVGYLLSKKGKQRVCKKCQGVI